MEVMTKKDYELIARVLLAQRQAAVRVVAADNEYWAALATGQDTEEAETSGVLVGVVDGIDSVARALADELAGTNPRFNRERFIAACAGKS
jgi:hypothetical protein